MLRDNVVLTLSLLFKRQFLGTWAQRLRHYCAFGPRLCLIFAWLRLVSLSQLKSHFIDALFLLQYVVGFPRRGQK